VSAQMNPVIAPAGGRRPVAGIGRVVLWNGGSAWFGRDTGLVQAHAHHAIQILLALTGRFRMRDGDRDWTQCIGAIVLPHARHQFDGQGSAVATLFLEPETAQGRALLQHHAGAGVGGLADAQVQALAAPLRAVFDDAAPDEALVAASQHAIAQLAGPSTTVESVDPRILRAIEWLRARLDTAIRLEDAAAVANLSASRFRHLFVAQTGISFRAYLLWARVGVAIGAGMSDQSWTAAAQSAGFADSAHLTRTCRRMFGLAPGMLVRG